MAMDPDDDRENQPLPRYHFRQLVMAMCSSYAYINVGLARIFSNAAHLSINDYDPTLFPEIGFGNYSGTILTAGILFGGLLLATPMLHFLGRRFSLQISCSVVSIGWVFISISFSGWFFHMGRFFTGVGIGIILSSVPIYICECVDMNRRKSLVSLPGCALAAGFLLGSTAGALIPWRLHALISAIIGFSNWFVLGKVPESPVWLVNTHQHIRAERACHWLRIPERQAAAASHAAITAAGRVHFWDILIPLLISCFSAVVQHLSALHIFVFYLYDTFETPLIEEHITPVHLGIIAIAALSGSICSMLTADRGHRRDIILASAFLCAICTGLFGSLLNKHEDIGLISVSTMAFLVLIIYGVSYGFGYLYLPFSLAAETTPRRFSFLQGPLVTTIHAIGIIAFSYIHPLLESQFDTLYIFLIYSGLTIMGSTIVWMFAPHTRGLGLHDINRIHLFSRRYNEDR